MIAVAVVGLQLASVVCYCLAVVQSRWRWCALLIFDYVPD
jgi:hypothetical protein